MWTMTLERGNTKVAVILIVIVLITLVGFGGFLIGSQQKKGSPTPTPSAFGLSTTVPLPTIGQNTASPSASPKTTTSPSPLSSPSVGFQVTAAAAAVAPLTSNACPTTFNFSGTITANGAGTVTYKWERSDGAQGPTESVTFTGATSQSVPTTWTLSNPGTKWERLRILTPNDLTSNQATFTLNCP